MYCTYISVYFYISLCVLSHFSVPRCPDDFVAHNGSCYHFSPNAGTIWEMNLLYCLGLAEFSTLGWSTNEQEQAFYVSNFQSTSGESIFIWIKYLFSIVFIFFIYTYISIFIVFVVYSSGFPLEGRPWRITTETATILLNKLLGKLFRMQNKTVERIVSVLKEL